MRATYALDKQTDARIRELAKRWNVSQAEVIHRSVYRSAEAEQPPPLTPAEVVARWRHGALPRSPTAGRRRAAENRSKRHAGDSRRIGAPRL